MTDPGRMLRTVLLAAMVAGVAGCGGAAPTGTAGAAGSSPAAATPSPGRTPDPDQGAAADALARFVARAAAIDASFHLEQWATIKADAQLVADATYSLDVSGSDFDGVITTAGQLIRIRSVDGRAWFSDDGSTWVEGDPIDAATSADIVSPWSYLGPPEELTFLSRDPKNMDNFQFANAGPIPYQTASMRSQGIEGTIDVLNFIVDPDGKPVSMMIHASATPSTGALKDKVLDMLTNVDFSRVDDPISVEAPE